MLARVVELVDTQVLGTCAHVAWGFESPLAHQLEGIRIGEDTDLKSVALQSVGGSSPPPSAICHRSSMAEHRSCKAGVKGSNPFGGSMRGCSSIGRASALHAEGCWFKSSRLHKSRGVAQSGSASALGAEGRRFESCHPDHLIKFR